MIELELGALILIGLWGLVAAGRFLQTLSAISRSLTEIASASRTNGKLT